MIVTALRAAKDGGCSTPVQIRAQLSCKEQEGSYVALPTWTSAFLCAVVGAGADLRLGAGGSRGIPLPSRQWPGTTCHQGGKLLASPSPTSVGAHDEV